MEDVNIKFSNSHSDVVFEYSQGEKKLEFIFTSKGCNNSYKELIDTPLKHNFFNESLVILFNGRGVFGYNYLPFPAPMSHKEMLDVLEIVYLHCRLGVFEAPNGFIEFVNKIYHVYFGENIDDKMPNQWVNIPFANSLGKTKWGSWVKVTTPTSWVGVKRNPKVPGVSRLYFTTKLLDEDKKPYSSVTQTIDIKNEEGIETMTPISFFKIPEPPVKL